VKKPSSPGGLRFFESLDHEGVNKPSSPGGLRSLSAGH